jgi:hypothetical protein
MQLALPHMTWALSPAASAPLQCLQQEQPLHQMWQMLTAALGYNTPIDPHVAAAMLLSAAAVGCSSSSAARQSEQVCITTRPLQCASVVNPGTQEQLWCLVMCAVYAQWPTRCPHPTARCTTLASLVKHLHTTCTAATLRR